MPLWKMREHIVIKEGKVVSTYLLGADIPNVSLGWDELSSPSDGTESFYVLIYYLC